MSRHLHGGVATRVSAIVNPCPLADTQRSIVLGVVVSFAIMSFLTSLVQGVHIVIGITPPPPEQTGRYAVIWAMALLGSAAIIGGFGYFLMGVVFAPR